MKVVPPIRHLNLAGKVHSPAPSILIGDLLAGEVDGPGLGAAEPRLRVGGPAALDGGGHVDLVAGEQPLQHGQRARRHQAVVAT